MRAALLLALALCTSSAAAASADAQQPAVEFAETPASELPTAPEQSPTPLLPEPLSLGRPAAAPAYEPEPSSSGGGAVLLPALALLALAAVALLVSKRRPRGMGMLQVVDSTNLGPRRSVVVVRCGEELLVLGASEAGITLLATRPASELPAEQAAAPTRFEEILARVGGAR